MQRQLLLIYGLWPLFSVLYVYRHRYIPTQSDSDLRIRERKKTTKNWFYYPSYFLEKKPKYGHNDSDERKYMSCILYLYGVHHEQLKISEFF